MRPASEVPAGRFAQFSQLELEILRPGNTSHRPALLEARTRLIDEIDREYERRAQLAEGMVA